MPIVKWIVNAFNDTYHNGGSRNWHYPIVQFVKLIKQKKQKIVQFVKKAKMGSNERQGPSWKEEIVQFVKEAKMGSSEWLGPSWKEVIVEWWVEYWQAYNKYLNPCS